MSTVSRQLVALRSTASVNRFVWKLAEMRAFLFRFFGIPVFLPLPSGFPKGEGCHNGRGTWKDVLSRDGLWIRHVLQHQETVDHPLVMKKAADHVEFDFVFSVMQGCQQEKILDQLAAVNSGMVVLVGNNPLCVEMDATIHSLSPHKQVLFGFINSAGVREET